MLKASTTMLMATPGKMASQGAVSRFRRPSPPSMPPHVGVGGGVPSPRKLRAAYPLLETQDEWVLHGFSYANYLAELGPDAQSKIYEKSSVDLAMKDAFRKMRHFLMTTRGLSEDEAISLMSVAVDFGITQVVDGNWGVHAIIKKNPVRRHRVSRVASPQRGDVRRNAPRRGSRSRSRTRRRNGRMVAGRAPARSARAFGTATPVNG